MKSLKSQIKAHEGLSLRPYKDTQGFLTIGYGRNLTTKGISFKEADMMLDNDIEMAQIQYEALPRAVRRQCNNIRRDILIEMIFQLGLVGTLKFRKMLGALEIGDYGLASAEMLDSLWHVQCPLRVEEMAEVMRRGKHGLQ